MSEIKVDKISPQSGTDLAVGDSGDTITIPSGATITNSGTATGFGGGKVLQVVSSVLTSSVSVTADGDWQDYTGVSGAITPSASSSKILVMCSTGFSSDSQTSRHAVRLVRNSTAISIGDAASSRARGAFPVFTVHSNTGNTCRFISIQHLDSPSTTSEVTYKLQFAADSGRALHVNKADEDTDTFLVARGATNFVCLEIDGS